WFCRKSDDDREASEYLDVNNFELEYDEDYLHSFTDYSLFTSGSSKQVNRLNENEVHYAREERLKEIQMWSIIREFGTYLVFLILIFLISFANREQNSFLQVNHLRNYFLNTIQLDNNYPKISTIDQCWEWIENIFASKMRIQPWYNSDVPQNLTGYINDKSNRIIGWSVMRQLRVKSTKCSGERVISICEDDYSFFNEEKRSFGPGWINETSVGGTYSSSILGAFKYNSSDELDSYVYRGEHGTYDGGGYVYEFLGSLSDLTSNLSKLHQLGWIDEKTRAILIQSTLYNPNVQLFTSVTFLLEFLSSSGVYPTYRFEPINFFDLLSTAQMLSEMTLMKFDTGELIEANAFLGPLAFTLFMFLTVFVCMSMFISIINDNFRRAQQDRIDNEEIFSFMLRRFLCWTGLKKVSELERQAQLDSRMHLQYFDPIENFPNRIAQLLEVINRVCFKNIFHL
ncbi:unnamed protein product, partial [Adineta ricciae]